MVPRSSLLISLLLLPLASQAAELSVEDRLNRLETELKSLREENTSLRTQLGTSSSTLVRAAGKETQLSIGGFTQLNAEFGDAPDARWSAADTRDRFLVRRARIGLQGSYKEPVSFKLEADFGNNAIGGKTGYSGQFTDAYASYAFSRSLNLRAGQFKTPFGYEQLLADTRTFFIERTLPNDRLTLGRQIGAGAFGDLAGGRVSYSTGIYNGNGTNNGTNDNDNFLAVARLNGVLVKSSTATLTAGVNGFTTNAQGTGFTGDREGWGVDAQLVTGPLEFQAEVLGVTASPRIGADVTSLGWSALAAWTLPAPAWRTVARFESYEADTDSTGTRSETLTLGLTYRLKGDDLKFSVNYLIGDPAGPLSNQNRILTSAQLVY
ncbi:MAG TPA: porin [Opitutaceae bacterium]